ARIRGAAAGRPAGRGGGGATAGGEKCPAPAVAGPGRLPSDRPLEGRGRSPLSGKGAITGEPVRSPSWRASLALIVPTRPRPPSSGIEGHLPGQAGSARPLEDDRRPDGGGLH